MFELQPEDQHFVIVKGDSNFNPARNKSVIASVIKKHELNRKKKMDQFVDDLRVRTDAVACYLKSQAAESNKPIEQYLGKRELAYMQGQKIVEEIQGRMRRLIEVK